MKILLQCQNSRINLEMCLNGKMLCIHNLYKGHLNLTKQFHSLALEMKWNQIDAITSEYDTKS